MSATPQLNDKSYAFISVYDKTGLAPLAKALVDVYGYGIISTGGTKKYLEENGIDAIESSEITGFGDLLDGRVKSLHPEIFAGILAKRDNPDHQVNLKIDTVVVNLYPFEQALTDKAAGKDVDMVEFIDIGGSSLIRAAAKNHTYVNVLCDPEQYTAFLQEFKLSDGESSQPFRQKLAADAFKRSMIYEQAIDGYFQSLTNASNTANNKPQTSTAETLTDHLTLELQKINDLRYGENPHQKAAVYGLGHNKLDFEQLHGKELSFNNLLDLEAAWAIVTEFTGKIACAVIKHSNPCGVAIGQSVSDAYHNAFFTDSLSAFGGIVAFNCPVDKAAAAQMKDVFLEVIVATDFDADALALLKEKKNLRLIKRPLPPLDLKGHPLDIRQASDSLFLVQQNDPEKVIAIDDLIENGGLQPLSEKKPTREQLRDLVFAWKVSKHVKSNAIVLAKDEKTLGIGAGQTSRIGALEYALKLACEESKDAVMASDGFLPAADNIHACVQARIAAVIQPGGSIKDKEIMELADQYGLSMVATGVREFKH